MIKRKQLFLLSALLLLCAILLMVLGKGILMHTQAGPDSPSIPHYYTYMHPMLYFAGGMYFAPLAVFSAVVSLLFYLITLVKNNKGKAAFSNNVVCLGCVLLVVCNRPITMINILIAALTLLATFLAYWASYRLPKTP